MNAYQNKNGVKLLAAVMILAMALAGSVVVFSDSADAEVTGTMTETQFIGSAVDNEITLTGDVTLTDENSDGIDLTGYTVNTAGHTITITSDLKGGIINAVSGAVVFNIGVNNGTADVTVTDTEVKMSGTELPTYAFNVINGNNLTLNGVKISAGENQKFGAVSFATYYAPGSDVVLQGCNIENGIITFKNLQNDSTLTVNSTTGFYMNYVDATNINDSVQINSDYKGTILGWDKSTTAGQTYGTGFELNVEKDFDFGNITTGDAVDSSAEFIITADKGVNVEYTGGNGVTINKDNSDRTGISNNVVALEGDIIIDGEAYLVGESVTIPADKTVIVRNGGSLDLSGSVLILYGDLVIENRGSVIGTNDNEKIVLMYGSSIENNGAIGGAIPVSVYANSANSNSYATMQNVVGVSFGLIRSGEAPSYTYTLSITGDVARATGTSSADDKTLTLTGVAVNGDLTTSRDITLSGTFNVIRNGTLTTNGPVDKATIGMLYGATVNIDGAFTDSTINAATEEGLTAKEASDNTVDGITSFSGNATGFSVTVDRVQYTAENGTDVMFNQRAYLSGSVASSERNGTATLQIAGNAFVASGVTVAIADKCSIETADATASTSAGLLIVEGTVQNVDGYDALDFVGAYYEITAEGETDAVGYITSFDAAMSAIANVDDDTIWVSGNADFPIEVTGNYELQAEQYVYSVNDVAALVITENAVLTVNDGAEFDAVTIADIDGMVVVMYGGDCEPADTLYDVMSENEAGDVTYAGLAIVLRNAQSGDVITVTGQNAEASTITVPSGVTLNIAPGAQLTVSRSVTVAEGGILNVEGALSIGTAADQEKNIRAIPGTLTINGTADIVDGTLTMVGGSSTNKANVNSTGTLVNDTVFTGTTDVSYNGAYYMNADLEYVLTSVANAIAGAVEDEATSITVIGTVNETADVDLQGITMTVNGKATLGNVDVQDSTVTVGSDGSLTATLVGQSGVEGSTVDAALQVTGAKITNVTNKSAVNAQNQTVWTFGFATITDGSVVVASGTVTAGTEMTGVTTDNVTDSLTVAAGATLAIIGTTDISKYETVSVDGTLDVAADGELTVTTADKQKFLVGGTMNVTGTADVDTMELTGTLNVIETETTVGQFTASGAVSVGDAEGAAGTIAGDVKFENTGYVLAYPGATVDIASFGDNAKSTQFFINGELYVTAYTDSDNNIAAVGTSGTGAEVITGFMNGVEITGFKTDGVINDVKNWFSDDVLETPVILSGNFFNIGGDDAAYIELEPATAYIQYSAGSQISLFVDGVRITSGDIVPLSVGTHKVVATVNPGFAGDVTITFNGQTVTGEFTVTPEMAGNTISTPIVLSVTGNITQDTPTVSGGDSGDDGMGLTDYLLIILVVLIVIMAIMVAMRLMRS